MRRFLFLILFVMLATSCVLDNSTDALYYSTGTVAFDTGISRGVSASIDYPSLLDKVWTLTATKLDDGGTVGAGTHEDFLLSDTLTLSIGLWRFEIIDSTGSIAGTAEAIIKVGNNTVAITVRSTQKKGTLSIENCNFLVSKIGTVNYVDCYVDDSRVNGTDWVVSQAMTDDGDFYVLPTITKELSEGIHTVRLYYGMDSGGRSSDTVSVRVINGMVTHFSVGEQEGNLSILISFETVEAIVND